jgi:multiple sugar transport system ATP-binding protein
VQMRTEITKLSNRLATTMIYVTHDQVEAMSMGDRICLMKDGRIQQVAEPLEIYNEPANMFVAAFMGSPPMNFFKGTMIEKHGRLHFAEANPDSKAALFLPVTNEQAEKLESWIDRAIYFGLRPEDFEDREPAAQPDPARILTAKLEVTEAMGAETYLYLNTGAHAFIARSQTQVRAKTDQPLSLVANMDKAHFFEAADSVFFRKDSGEVDVEKWQTACAKII